MSKSIKTNYIFSLVNVMTAILFPLITFPYATRIMEADGMGQVGFFTSIVSYVSLFTSLGIPIYAVREIARVRENNVLMSRTAIEILLLQSALVVIGYVAIGIICVTVSKVAVDLPLFLILSFSILFNAIGCEWFYQGIEEFRYIALRGLFVRVVYVILLFLLVHAKSDILIYAGLTVLGTVGNNVFNFCRLWKYVKPQLVLFRELQLFRHVKPAIKIFALNIVISLYLNLDTVMIGFLKDNYAVGYYDGATKIARIMVSIIQALQTVMIPRFSYLANKNDMTEFHELVQKIVDFVFAVCIPMTVILAVMAPTLIHLFCGPTYTPAIVTLELISPIVFMISMSGIACFQILYPQGKETIAIWSTATGALVNLIICFILIPDYGHNGAGIAVLFGETAVTITMYLYGRKYICLKWWDVHYLNCLIGGALSLLIIFYIRMQNLGDWSNLFVIPAIGAIVYMTYLFIRKDTCFIYVYQMIRQKTGK